MKLSLSFSSKCTGVQAVIQDFSQERKRKKRQQQKTPTVASRISDQSRPD